MKTKKRPEVHHYNDYRTYLRDLTEHLSESPQRLTLRKIAAQAEVSVSQLSMILSGARKLTGEVLTRIAPVLGLSPQEHSSLEALLHFNHADSQQTAVSAFARLSRSAGFKKQNPEEARTFGYLTHWYYVAIREMAALPGFQLDAKWIQSRLGFAVPVVEIEKALRFLLENRLIEKREDGSILPPETSIECHAPVYKLAKAQFHREVLALSSKAIESVPSEERKILGYTLSVNTEAFERINRILEQAYTEIQKIAQEPRTSDRICHVELAMIPLTRKNEENPQ